MGLRAIGDLVAHARGQHERATVGELCVQLAFEAQEDVSLRAPVIGAIAGRVIDHAYANGAEILRAPQRLAGLSWMLRGRHTGPVRGSEGNLRHLHVSLLILRKPPSRASSAPRPPP